MCLPGLGSGRNLIPNQHKSKWILCVQCPEFWKSQPLTLVGVCVSVLPSEAVPWDSCQGSLNWKLDPL